MPFSSAPGYSRRAGPQTDRSEGVAVLFLRFLRKRGRCRASYLRLRAEHRSGRVEPEGERSRCAC